MIETKRADKKSNQIKVVKALIDKPDATEQQIADATGLSTGSAHNHKKEIEENGVDSNILDRVLEMDDKIMDLSNQITLQKIIDEAPKDAEGKIDVSKLSLVDVKMIGDYANNSTKRKAIFDKGDKLDPNRDIVISI